MFSVNELTQTIVRYADWVNFQTNSSSDYFLLFTKSCTQTLRCLSPLLNWWSKGSWALVMRLSRAVSMYRLTCMVGRKLGFNVSMLCSCVTNCEPKTLVSLKFLPRGVIPHLFPSRSQVLGRAFVTSNLLRELVG